MSPTKIKSSLHTLRRMLLDEIEIIILTLGQVEVSELKLDIPYLEDKEIFKYSGTLQVKTWNGSWGEISASVEDLCLIYEALIKLTHDRQIRKTGSFTGEIQIPTGGDSQFEETGGGYS